MDNTLITNSGNVAISSKQKFIITDPASLEQAIAGVNARVKISELDLQQRLSELPRQTMKKAASTVVPTYLTTKVAGSVASAAWNLVKITAGQKTAILPLIGAAAKAGIFSFLKKKVPPKLN